MKFRVRAIERKDIVVDAKTAAEAEFLARESDDWEVYEFDVIEITEDEGF